MTSGSFVIDAATPGYWYMVPGARDRGEGANVAFADGHVVFEKWRFPSRTRSGWTTNVRNELDRADLTWVLSVLPAPDEL